MNNDATEKLHVGGFKRPWPPCGDEVLAARKPALIKMKAGVAKMVNSGR